MSGIWLTAGLTDQGGRRHAKQRDKKSIIYPPGWQTDFRSEVMFNPEDKLVAAFFLVYWQIESSPVFCPPNLLVGRSGIECIICGKPKQNMSWADEYTSGLMVGFWGRKFRLVLKKQVTANWVEWVSFQTNVSFPTFLAATLQQNVLSSVWTVTINIMIHNVIQLHLVRSLHKFILNLLS